MRRGSEELRDIGTGAEILIDVEQVAEVAGGLPRGSFLLPGSPWG